MSRRPLTEPVRGRPDASVTPDGWRGSVCHSYRTMRAPSGFAASLLEPSSTTADPSTDTSIHAIGPAVNRSSNTSGSDVSPDPHDPMISFRPSPSGTVTLNPFPSIWTGARTSSPLTVMLTSPHVEVPVSAWCHANASPPRVSKLTGPVAEEGGADADGEEEDVSLTFDVHPPTDTATTAAARIRRPDVGMVRPRTTPSTPRAKCPGR